jgi:hypothetical protein
VPAGHRPDIAEAERKLEALGAYESRAEAFTFRRAFPALDAGGGRLWDAQSLPEDAPPGSAAGRKVAAPFAAAPCRSGFS